MSLRVSLTVAALFTCACGCAASPSNSTERSGPPSGDDTTTGGKAAPAAHEDPADPEDGPLVTVQLLADTDRIGPNDELTVAARFEIARGWHIYWSNPGASGLETELAITAPDGFALADVRYPGPVTFSGTDGDASFGYAGETALFAKATAPAELAAADVRFEAHAEWLACSPAACVRGSKTIELTLPVGADAQPANVDVLAAHRERLPQPWAEATARGATLRRDGSSFDISVPGARKLEWFPALSTPVERVAGSGDAIRLDYKAGVDTPRGVLHADGTYYQLEDDR